MGLHSKKVKRQFIEWERNCDSYSLNRRLISRIYKGNKKLMPVILATQETEIKRITVCSQPGANIS
jgi:hypothetical protein